MSEILKISNLSLFYGTKQALDKVNLSVTDTDFIGVIGPNGGGKTSLLKVILGLVKPTSGEVIYGSALNGSPIGYLPQLTQVDKDFPINCLDMVLSGLFSNSRLFRWINKTDREKAFKLLEKMKIGDKANHPFGELSGGEAQRVLLCRALISDPKLLILDEPETYADSHYEKQLYDLLAELNREIAIILVSHDVGMVSSYVKTVVCLNSKAIVHPIEELSEEILENYGCPIELLAHGKVPHRVLHQH